MIPVGWMLLLGGAVIEVTGSAECPTAPRVSARLEQLSPALAEGRPRLRAELEGSGDAVHLQLFSLDGRRLAHRQLAGAPSCEERAAAVAGVIVSLAEELEDEGLIDPPEAAPSPEVLERTERLPPDDADGDGDGDGDRGEAGSDALPPVMADVTAGLSASIADGRVAAGGLLAGGLTSSRTRFGGQVSLAALGTRRTVEVPATFARFALTLSPHFRMPVWSASVDVHAGPALGVFALFPQSGSRDTRAEAGLTGGVRVLGLGGFWLGVQGYYWPIAQPLPSGGQAPRAEVVAAGGLAWTAP